MTTSSTGESRPNFPNFDLALSLICGAHVLADCAVQFGGDSATPDRAECLRSFLRDALTALGNEPEPQPLPSADRIERTVVDEADNFFGALAAEAPYNGAHPVPWTVAKELIRAGIVAGIELAGESR